MANSDTPFGFKPVGNALAADWSEKITWYTVSANNTAIYLYDLVTHSGTASADGKFPMCKQAAASDQTVLGAAVAFRTDPPTSNTTSLVGDNSIPRREYCPAATTMYIGVTDDPFTIYEVQEDSDSENLAVTAIGGNINFVVGAGSSTTGLSGMELNSDTKATTDTLPVRILRLADGEQYMPNGNALGTNAKWRVMLNKCFYKGPNTGA